MIARWWKAGFESTWQEPLGLLVLRLGTAYFYMVWAVSKFLATDQYQKLWGYFHGIDIGAGLALAMGSGQLVLVVCIALGVARWIAYPVGFLTHLVTVIVIIDGLIDPFLVVNGFPRNRGNAVAVPVLAAFAALWLLRRHDRWSLDEWLKRRRLRAAG
jgi:putative oxidoreductase